MKFKTNTAVDRNFKMPNKMKIKEVLIIDVGSTVQQSSPVSNPVMKIKNETAVCSDCEVKIKEEDLMLDIGSSEENRPLISDYVMDIKSEAAVCSDSEMQNKIKIKKHGLVPDTDLENLDLMKIKNNSDVVGMFTKIELKEEPCWQKRISTQVTSQPESSCVLNIQVCSEVKDEANEVFSATESIRLCPETPPTTCSAIPYLFSTTEEKDSLKCGKKNLEFTEANIHEAYRSNILETSAVKQTVCSYKSKTPHDHKQSEKLNKRRTNSNKSYVCEICKKKFLKWNVWKSHILIHEGKRPFKCDVCEKNFTQKGNLLRHMLIHRGKRPFKCDICEKSFTQKGVLYTHILIHQGKRPFNCDFCEKSFTQKGDLNRHILIHQDKRPYHCDVCGNNFTRKGNLIRHILIHRDIRSD